MGNKLKRSRRNVDTSEEEPEVDLAQFSGRIKETDRAIKAGNDALLKMLGELTFADSETEDAVEEFMNVLREV